MNNVAEEQRTVLFDLEGVLTNYDEAMRRSLREISSPAEPAPASLYWHFKNTGCVNERIKLFREYPGWWKKLQQNSSGFEVLDACLELGFPVSVIVRKNYGCPDEDLDKRVWYDTNVVPVLPGSELITVDAKCDVPGIALVTGSRNTLNAWLSKHPDGLGILMPTSTNGGYQHSQAIRYDYDNLEKIKEQLRAVSERCLN